jgi:hypothetical protein
MDCVFVKARKISKALKSNRGSAVNYSKYLTRELPGIDYTDKGNILASGIEGTTEKPLEFWTKAEERENQTKRKDSARFAKEYIMALPHNLSIEEQSRLCKTIAEKLSKGGRVVQWVHHEPDKEGDERNYHCHFLMSEREYKNGIFAEKKNRDWNSKKCLADHKKEIGNEINKALERFNLPQWSVEIGEDVEPKIDKTENQIRAERAERKKLSKTEKKLKLAEVKLNGFGRFENGLRYTADTNTKLDNRIKKQFDEFGQLADNFADFQRVKNTAEAAERRKQEQRKLDLQRAEEQRKLEAERAEREREENARRIAKSNNRSSGWSR